MTQHHNEVRLVGRIGNGITARTLPSGAILTSFSVVVDRSAREVHGRSKVDTIACQTTRATVCNRLDKLDQGQVVEVSGSLRRRFWKSGAGLASATEVDVKQLSVVRDASR